MASVPTSEISSSTIQNREHPRGSQCEIDNCLTILIVTMRSLAAPLLLVVCLQLPHCVKSQVQDDIAYSLGPLLSPGAEIVFPGSTDFLTLTSTVDAKKPQMDVVVKVATEQDVQRTVSIM